MSFLRVIRGFAEASLVVLAFAFAILLIGIPIALIVRGLYEGLSWLVRLSGDTSAPVQALVWVSSVAGGLAIAAILARLLVRFFHWRHSETTSRHASQVPRQSDFRNSTRSAFCAAVRLNPNSWS